MRNNIMKAKTRYSITHHQLVDNAKVTIKPGIRNIESK
jgi:hypothetical protein